MALGRQLVKILLLILELRRSVPGEGYSVTQSLSKQGKKFMARNNILIYYPLNSYKFVLEHCNLILRRHKSSLHICKFLREIYLTRIIAGILKCGK
jgi:hypothetical protein